MNETERALFDRVVRLVSATRWPSGRRVLVAERRWMIRFLADWVRSLAGRDQDDPRMLTLDEVTAAMSDPLIGALVDRRLGRDA